MNMPIEDFEAITEGARLAGVLPELQSIIDKMEDTLEQRIFKRLREGTLTPEEAIFAWQEKLILRQLVGRFNSKVRIGTTLAEHNQGELNG